MKNHSAPLQPTMNLDTAADTMNFQSRVQAAELDRKIHNDFTKTDKSWSNLPTAPHTMTFGEELITVVADRSKLYTPASICLSNSDII